MDIFVIFAVKSEDNRPIFFFHILLHFHLAVFYFLSALTTTITYIIPTNNKWVIANYKETQIENLYVGQKVRMTVDAISNKEFEGTVTAISGATGSKYSLVPTDNSAGNFVKIQQRVPVRIDFNNLSKEDNEHLAAGMMVVVKAERK
jgi:membrane fusion protein, multidrug efflux system